MEEDLSIDSSDVQMESSELPPVGFFLVQPLQPLPAMRSESGGGAAAANVDVLFGLGGLVWVAAVRKLCGLGWC